MTLSLLAQLPCIFLAAVARGCTGFGFSLLAITTLTLFAAPRAIVPAIFVLEVAASAHLLVGAWRDVHGRSLAFLALGCLFGTPLGVYALAHAPARPITLALALTVLAACVLLLRGFTLRRMPGRAATVGTGFVSGLLNGALGTGGPPVILLYFGSPAGVATGRASIIAYFLFTDLLGLAWQGADGLLTQEVFERALLWSPALFGGLWVGNRLYARIDPARFRRWVLWLLMGLALIGIGRALLPFR